MKRIILFLRNILDRLWSRFSIGMRAKLIILFLVAKVIPLILLTGIAWIEIVELGSILTESAVRDSSDALNDMAVENIERMTTDAARRVAEFLYARDSDILMLAGLSPDENLYAQFAKAKTGRLMQSGEWTLAEDGVSWVQTGKPVEMPALGGISTNAENEDSDGFNYRAPEVFEYINVPLYDEITFIDVHGNELIKVLADGSTKKNYPVSAEKRNVSLRENTYVKAENYFEKLKTLQPGEIYVSDVIGAYVGSNYIGMYTPSAVAKAAGDRGYDIEYSPEAQAYAGKENPNGQRFEGIVRWATPVTGGSGEIIGYVTFALNHDHIMEFVDHITPMGERYTQLPSAFEGNYAFIWDYNCRSICHPRHHSITGYDPETGEPAVPWLESSIYDAWQASGVENWSDFIVGWPVFDSQSRSKAPASALTRQGLVGLDGRYLNNAPQCTGWMDLTEGGGSGSFYILWSGLEKLTTAAAIPYYTGQYAPGESNGFSQRGFGFVAIGAGLDDFKLPSVEIRENLTATINDNLYSTMGALALVTAVLIFLVVLIAIWMASFLTDNITKLIRGISRFRAGERHFRFKAPVKDEFGMLADAFDGMADGIDGSVNSPLFITDMGLRIIYANDLALSLCNKTIDEVVGHLYQEFSVYPPNTKYSPILAIQEGREAEPYSPPETGRFIKGTANYFLDSGGHKVGYYIISNDVTEMVLERMKIEEQRTLLDTIFSSSPDLIWYMDANGKYMAVNPRVASIAGLAESDFVGKTASDMFPAAIAEIMNGYDREMLKAKAPLYTVEHLRFADGHEETLDTVRTPIFDSSGAVSGLLGFARNVSARVEIETELRETQQHLQQAVSDANRANAHKGEFLARMSHEIRTPMNAILGMTNIALRRLEADSSDVSQDLLPHVRQIGVSSQHLLGLLNDILDLSKIEAGKIELSEEPVDLSRLVSTVVGIIKPRCDEKNITFGTFFEDISPSTFLTDSLRLRQVLINLLGNAVKFTPDYGRVEFRVEKLERLNDCTHLRFSVRDTGIGIEKDALATIFQSFEQGGNSISRKYGGTGLGLAISRSIVQLLGGDLTVSSEVGVGSEFSFSLWLRETEAIHSESEIFADAEGKYTLCRALLVDDVAINRLIVVSMLEPTCIEIYEAEDGEQAVQMLADSPEGYYDIIFMDVHMPKMDGYEASRTIRGLNRADARNIPIVALTANAFREDIDKALANGMNAHIAKPVEPDKLFEVIHRFVTPK